MEEYEKTDKTWWQATDFMYKHLLSTGQSWSHVQKLEFVQNLSGLLKSIERNAKIPTRESFPSVSLNDKQKFDVGKWKFLVIYYDDGEQKTFETWVDTSKPFNAKMNDRSVAILG